jgi:hypothetical protein
MLKMRRPTLREFEIRTENRYTLHPQGKKRCTVCEMIYDNIIMNFDIHKKNKNGTTAYTGQCKHCMQKIRSNRNTLYRTQIDLYVRRLLPAIRCRAKEEGLDFDLTKQDLVDIWNLQNGFCYYTNQKLDLQAAKEHKKAPHINFPSVDKLTPHLGYVRSNIVWCLYGVNRMKNNFSKDQFVQFCKEVIKIHG